MGVAVVGSGGVPATEEGEEAGGVSGDRGVSCWRGDSVPAEEDEEIDSVGDGGRAGGAGRAGAAAWARRTSAARRPATRRSSGEARSAARRGSESRRAGGDGTAAGVRQRSGRAIRRKERYPSCSLLL